MILLVDAEQAFDKVQHPFMIKNTLNKLGRERNFLNLIKNVFKNLQHHTCEKLDVFPEDQEQGRDVCCPIQHHTRSPS